MSCGVGAAFDGRVSRHDRVGCRVGVSGRQVHGVVAGRELDRIGHRVGLEVLERQFVVHVDVHGDARDAVDHDHRRGRLLSAGGHSDGDERSSGEGRCRGELLMFGFLMFGWGDRQAWTLRSSRLELSFDWLARILTCFSLNYSLNHGEIRPPTDDGPTTWVATREGALTAAKQRVLLPGILLRWVVPAATCADHARRTRCQLHRGTIKRGSRYQSRRGRPTVDHLDLGRPAARSITTAA